MRVTVLVVAVLCVGILSSQPASALFRGTQAASLTSPETCSADNFQIQGVGVNANDVREHVSQALDARAKASGVTTLSQIVFEGFSCLDGRTTDTSTATTMGGDMGEFVAALAVLEQHLTTGDQSPKAKLIAKPLRELTQFEVDSLLLSVLAKGGRGKFRMCTDMQALTRLCQSTRFCFPRDDLRNPPEAIRNDLLLWLTVPENVGCEHIRLMLSHPSLYQVRRGLVEAAIRSFYRILWNHLPLPLTAESHAAVGAKLDLTIYEGLHEESALLNMVAPQNCKNEILMLSPITKQSSFRVFYPEAAKLGRQYLAQDVWEQAVTLGMARGEPQDSGDFNTKIQTYAEVVMETSLAHITQFASGASYPSAKVIAPETCCSTHFTPPTNTKIQFSDPEKPANQNNFDSRFGGTRYPLVCGRGAVLVRKSELVPASLHPTRLDGFSSRQLYRHFRLGSGSPFEFVDPVSWPVTTLDGREMDSILGIPGASLGQFALIVSVVEMQFNQKLDVHSLLSNYILSTTDKTPTFSYVIDTHTLHAVCSELKVCPDNSLPWDKRIAELMAMLQNPTKQLQPLLLDLLANEAGTYIGDAYLHFLQTDKGLSRGRQVQTSHLSPLQANLLTQLQEALRLFATTPTDKLLDTAGLTAAEYSIIVRVVGAFVDHSPKGRGSPLRQHMRVKSVLEQCIHDNPNIATKLESKQTDENNKAPEQESTPKEEEKLTKEEEVFVMCRGAMKRMVANVIDEEGDFAAGQTDLELQRRAFRDVLPRVIRAFFQLLWRQPSQVFKPFADGIAAKMDLTIVEGAHQERAFARVTTDSSCSTQLSPLLTPQHTTASPQKSTAQSTASVWVYHERASQRLRSQMLDFMSTAVSSVGVHKEELRGVATDVDNANVHRFVFEILADLPAFDVVFGGDCCPQLH